MNYTDTVMALLAVIVVLSSVSMFNRWLLEDKLDRIEKRLDAIEGKEKET